MIDKAADKIPLINLPIVKQIVTLALKGIIDNFDLDRYPGLRETVQSNSELSEFLEGIKRPLIKKLEGRTLTQDQGSVYTELCNISKKMFPGRFEVPPSDDNIEYVLRKIDNGHRKLHGSIGKYGGEAIAQQFYALMREQIQSANESSESEEDDDRMMAKKKRTQKRTDD